jgi:hypothetical protein
VGEQRVAIGKRQPEVFAAPPRLTEGSADESDLEIVAAWQMPSDWAGVQNLDLGDRTSCDGGS